jgi:hypothetical protein
MNHKPGGAVLTLILIVAALFIGTAIFLYYEPGKNSTDETPTNTEETPVVEETEESTDSTDMSTDVDMSTWVKVDETGYEFMHPNYFIQDNGDHYILATEPRQGQEFTALVIYKPMDVADPKQMLQLQVDEMDASLGTTVTSDPKQIQLEGFKSAYWVGYEATSGPTTGDNKIYLLQSPYTDKWVMMEYSVNDNAEAVMKSFKFVDE